MKLPSTNSLTQPYKASEGLRPMKIITRYVLSEMLQVFLVALTALTLFMLVIGLTKEAQQQGTGAAADSRTRPIRLT